MLKNLKSIILICLAFIFASAFFYSVRAETYYLGDIDLDNKVTASDARTILRCAVGTEKLQGIAKTLADIDGNGTISSDDARSALRIGVGTDPLTLMDSVTGYKINIKNGNVIDTKKAVYKGHAYTNLTETQKKRIAYLAFKEQGTLEGAKIEISLMANLCEQKRSDYNIYGYIFQKNSWFGPVRRGQIPSNPSYGNGFTEEYVKLVNDILVNGNRYLPNSVNEHDWIKDIKSISAGNKDIRSDYIPFKTVIYNRDGAKYVFVGFAPNNGDPFGYLVK